MNINSSNNLFTQQLQRIGLAQVEGFVPPKEITVQGQKWELIRDSNSPFSSIPPLNQMTWEFNSNIPLNFYEPTVYWYCLHGIKHPTNQGEKPVRLLYQWFHTIQIPLNPNEIPEADWDKANVYRSEVGRFELDFAAAMFGITESTPQVKQVDYPEVITATVKEKKDEQTSTE